jgi:hypothetical protein
MNGNINKFKWDGVLEYNAFIYIRQNYNFNPDVQRLSFIRLIRNTISE